MSRVRPVDDGCDDRQGSRRFWSSSADGSPSLGAVTNRPYVQNAAVAPVVLPAESASFALAVLADSQPGFVADGFGNYTRIVRQPRGIMDYN